jgi:hypothetical protein
MAVLNNPVQGSNMVERFNDFVAATANANIVWGTNSKPFDEFPDSDLGGTTSGRGTVSGNLGLTGQVTASTILDAFATATGSYTRIRLLRARLNVTGGGGNNGSRPTPGIIFDDTRVTHMSSSYDQNVGFISEGGGVFPGTIISRASLQGGAVIGDGSFINLSGYFVECRERYRELRNNTTTITVNVCHASCHSSCHSSRTRR